MFPFLILSFLFGVFPFGNQASNITQDNEKLTMKIIPKVNVQKLQYLKIMAHFNLARC